MEVWNEGKIKDFVDVKGGKRLPKGKQLAGFPTAHPYIRIRDIGKSKILQLTDDYEYVDDETQKEISRYIVSKGDILISVVGTIGLVGIVGDTLDGANQTENCDKLTNFKGIDRDFLYYYLVSPLGQGEIAKGTVGAVQPKLPLKNIQDFTVRFPSLQTQRKIASVLSALDDKIEKNTEVNENLLQQAEAIYKDWFCNGLLGNKSLPWRSTTIGDITSLVVRGITPKYNDDTDQMVINQKCIRNHMIDLTLARRHLPKAITEKWLIQGDLLINSTGAGTLGRVAQVWFVPNNLTVDSHVTIVRPKSAELRNYIGFWGLTHEAEIESLHTGSTGQTELPRERVKAMELLLPDDSTLSRFNGIITPITQAIVENQQENIRLTELRETLLPRLMSGELDVSELDL